MLTYSRIRPLVTSMTAALQLLLYFEACIMLKIVPDTFLFMLSSLFCRGLHLPSIQLTSKLKLNLSYDVS